jgi:uncharacterized protein YjbI with pentapeptide repeats
LNALDGFVNGSQGWRSFLTAEGAGTSEARTDLRRQILQYANHEGSTFEYVDFRGATFRNGYFIDCDFVDCSFQQAAFEDSSLKDCSFVRCTFDESLFRRSIVDGVTILEGYGRGTDLEECTVSALAVEAVRWGTMRTADCDRLSLKILRSSILNVTIAGARELDVRVNGGEGLSLVLKDADGTVVVESANAGAISIGHSSAIRLLLRNLVLRDLDIVDDSSRVEINAIQTMLFGAELFRVNLPRSTFVGSALVDCVWPDAEGKSHWSGRYSPPSNLVTQPIADIAGVPEDTKQHIQRAQMLIALEARSHVSRWTWLIHRIVGCTTAHGNNPGRLIAASCILAFMQGTIGELVGERRWLAARFFGEQSLTGREALHLWLQEALSVAEGVLKQSWGYLSVILSLKNRSAESLNPFMTGISTLIGVFFLGIFINVISSQISKRS